jgi:nucleotide-binding universal stress UspA family protein
MIRKIQNAPLLVIPSPLNFKPIKKIAFATGFKRPYSKKELEPLVTISSLYNADIKIVHVNKKEKMSDIQRVNVHELFKLLGSAQPENTWLYDNVDIDEAISSFVQLEQIDILAMISYKHNAIVRLFREATLKNIAKHATIPLLIIPKID